MPVWQTFKLGLTHLTNLTSLTALTNLTNLTALTNLTSLTHLTNLTTLTSLTHLTNLTNLTNLATRSNLTTLTSLTELVRAVRPNWKRPPLKCDSYVVRAVRPNCKPNWKRPPLKCDSYELSQLTNSVSVPSGCLNGNSWIRNCEKKTKSYNLRLLFFAIHWTNFTERCLHEAISWIEPSACTLQRPLELTWTPNYSMVFFCPASLWKLHMDLSK